MRDFARQGIDFIVMAIHLIYKSRVFLERIDKIICEFLAVVGV
jgi:hypothetical protein